MNKSNPITIGLITAAIIAGVRYFYNLNKLSDEVLTKFVNARLLKPTLRESYIETQIDVVNPTPGALNIKGVVGRISAGSNTFAYFSTDKSFQIKGKSTARITLKFVVSNQQLFKLALDSVERKEIPSFKVDYKLRTAFGSIPQSFEINPKELL